MAGFAYPYDPTATDPACLIGPEAHKLSDYQNKWRAIIPVGAPFYRNDFKLRHVESGRTLIEGLDYYLGHYFEDASVKTKLAIYGSVMINDSAITGTIEFTKYRTLGGGFNIPLTEARVYLSDVDLPDPRNVDWSEVMRYPREVPPMADVPSTLEEAIATDEIAASLDKLRAKLEELALREKGQYAAVFASLRALEKKVYDYKLISHPTSRPEHSVTYAQLGALKKDASAADALRAYGRTLSELVAYIASLGITDADAARYMPLLNGVFQGRLSFTDGAACTIQNELGTSYINLVSGSINIITNGNVGIVADSDNNSPRTASMLRAGANALSVHSGKAGVYDSPIYNGYYLIHAGNLADYLEATGSSSTAPLQVVTANTSSVSLSGNGQSSTPLVGNVSFVVGSTAQAGLVKLADDIRLSRSDIVASSAAIVKAVQEIDKYAKNTITVNGARLNADVSLNSAMLGLGNVDNTAPAQKVASDAFKAAVAGKANLAHTHVASDLKNIPTATTTQPGVGILASSGLASTNTLATPAIAKVVQDRISDMNDVFSQKLDIAHIPATRALRVKNTGTLISASGFNVTILSDLVMYNAGEWYPTEATSFNIQALFPTSYQNATVYLYAALDSAAGVFKYTASLSAPPQANLQMVGVIKTGTAAVSSLSLPEYSALDISGINDTYLLELREHMADTKAHGLAGGLKSLAGLSNIENKSLLSAITPTNFSTVFDTWYRFSHSASNVFPASASELSAWAFDSATDTIKCTINSNTFIGFVNNVGMGDYRFETILSSTDGDDDVIGIVIGFYKDPTTGKEHTLSAFRTLCGTTPSRTHSMDIVYNAFQADQQVLWQGGNNVALGWNAAGTCRIACIRKGTAWTVDFYGHTAVEGDVLLKSATVDIADFPVLEVFRGETRFGYCAQSQNSSSYKNVRRPDEDGRSYYAAASTVSAMKAVVDSDVVFTSGTVADGATIPIPSGYTAAQCRAILAPLASATGPGAVTTGMTARTYSVNSSLVATARETINGSLQTKIAIYYLVASKSFA